MVGASGTTPPPPTPTIKEVYEACRRDPVCWVGYGEPRPTPEDMVTFEFMTRTIEFTTGPLEALLNGTTGEGRAQIIQLILGRALLQRGMLCDLGHVPWHNSETGAFECLCRAERACDAGKPDLWLAKVIVGIFLLILVLHCGLSIMQLRFMGLLLLLWTRDPAPTPISAAKPTTTPDKPLAFGQLTEALLRVLYL